MEPIVAWFLQVGTIVAWFVQMLAAANVVILWGTFHFLFFTDFVVAMICHLLTHKLKTVKSTEMFSVFFSCLLLESMRSVGKFKKFLHHLISLHLEKVEMDWFRKMCQELCNQVFVIPWRASCTLQMTVMDDLHKYLSTHVRGRSPAVSHAASTYLRDTSKFQNLFSILSRGLNHFSFNLCQLTNQN